MALLNNFLGVILLLLLTSCTEKVATPLKLGTNVWLGYEPLYLARSKHFLDNRNIRLAEFSSASQTIQAFRNEIIDAAALTLDEALLLVESGEQITIVLVLDISNGADAIVGQKEIKTIADLRGKKIGVEGNALGAYMLHRALTLSKLADKSITTVLMEVDQHQAAFLANKVDAVVTFEPVLTKLLAAGGNLLFSSKQLSGEIADVLVVRNKFLKDHHAIIQRLINSWFEALALIKDKPLVSAKLMSGRMGLNFEDTLASLRGVIFASAKINQQLLKTKPTPTLLLTAKKLATVMKGHALLKTNINIDTSPLFTHNNFNYIAAGGH